MDLLKKLKNSITVSVQSMPDDPTHNEICMTAFMKSAVKGGAKGLRLADFNDIKNAKRLFGDIAVIGLTKPEKIPENYKELVYITPDTRSALDLIDAGADIIAFDATKRHDYTDILRAVKNAGRLAMADISTFEEALNAQKAGVDIVSTTLSGYTLYSPQIEEPDFELLEKCTANLNIPVFLEGRVWEKRQVKKAFELNAHSVVIGSAITRPWLITERFANG